MTRPRPEIARYFAGPGTSAKVPLDGGLRGLLAEIAKIRRQIEGRERQTSVLAGWFASLLRRWQRLLARKPRPGGLGPAGVSDPWIA